MKPVMKSIIAIILMVVTLFFGIDTIPAEKQGHIGTVIHKTMIPEEQPTHVIIVWIADEYQPLRLTGSKAEWDTVDVGDKIMVYFRDGWITEYNYTLNVQGGFEEL